LSPLLCMIYAQIKLSKIKVNNLHKVTHGLSDRSRFSE